MKVDLQNYNFKVSEIRDILKDSLGDDLFNRLVERFKNYGSLYRIGMYSAYHNTYIYIDSLYIYKSVDDFFHRNSVIIGDVLINECYLRFELKLIEEDGPYND